MQHIYIFSGLGADKRVFHKLDLTGFTVTYIHWISPDLNETIEQYAKRLTSQISESKPILIGLSFGGFIAIEIAKQIETDKVILIASCKSRSEMPFYFRLSGVLRLHKLMSTDTKKLSKPFAILNWFFGLNALEDKQLLQRIISETDPKFFTWAIDKVVSWKNEIIPKNCIHIHGTSDHIFPFGFVQSTRKIVGGGHLLTLTHPKEISQLLRDLI